MGLSSARRSNPRQSAGLLASAWGKAIKSRCVVFAEDLHRLTFLFAKTGDHGSFGKLDFPLCLIKISGLDVCSPLLQTICHECIPPCPGKRNVADPSQTERYSDGIILTSLSQMNCSSVTISFALLFLCLSCGSEQYTSRNSSFDERRIIDEMKATLKSNRENDEWIRQGRDPDQACSAFLLKLSREDWKYPGWVNGVLPEAEWPLDVRKLEPLKVYRRGPDVVLMMALESGTERGFYFMMPPSSMLPTSTAEWNFVPLGYNVWSYMRIINPEF